MTDIGTTDGELVLRRIVLIFSTLAFRYVDLSLDRIVFDLWIFFPDPDVKDFRRLTDDILFLPLGGLAFSFGARNVHEAFSKRKFSYRDSIQLDQLYRLLIYALDYLFYRLAVCGLVGLQSNPEDYSLALDLYLPCSNDIEGQFYSYFFQTCKICRFQ